MKEKRIQFLCCFFAILSFICVSCGSGGSDNDTVIGSGSSPLSIISGNNSCKITKMTVDSAGIYSLSMDFSNNMKFYHYWVPTTYILEYDSEGRLSKVYKETKEGKEQILMIDYDFMLVRSNQLNINAKFTLNDKGYISQIENCKLLYNKEGYLTKTERNGDLWTILYNNGEIEKCLSEFESGKSELYYFLGEDPNAGEMCFCYQCPFGELGSNITDRQLIGFFAYQAGLFGKITKHIRRLPESKDKKAEMNLKPEKNSFDERYRILLYFTFSF